MDWSTGWFNSKTHVLSDTFSLIPLFNNLLYLSYMSSIVLVTGDTDVNIQTWSLPSKGLHSIGKQIQNKTVSDSDKYYEENKTE